VVVRHNADIADTPELRDVAMATTFWLSMGYNVDCITASSITGKRGPVRAPGPK